MSSTIAAVLAVVLLTAWHLHTRRHPHWQASSEGRFYICIGYPAVAIAVYWLSVSPTDTTWEWVVGNLWALAAAASFVVGFNALNDVTTKQQEVSEKIESIFGEEAVTKHDRNRPATDQRRNDYDTKTREIGFGPSAPKFGGHPPSLDPHLGGGENTDFKRLWPFAASSVPQHQLSTNRNTCMRNFLG